MMVSLFSNKFIFLYFHKYVVSFNFENLLKKKKVGGADCGCKLFQRLPYIMDIGQTTCVMVFILLPMYPRLSISFSTINFMKKNKMTL